LNVLQKIYLANLLTSGAKKDAPYYLDLVRNGEAYTLESYWKTNSVTRLLDNNPDIKVFLDSGAHSLLSVYTKDQGVKQDEDGIDYVEYSRDNFDLLDPNKQLSVSARSAGKSGKISRSGALKCGASKFVDYSFADNKEVKEFIEKYIAFVHKYKDRFYGYVNMDIIFDPEKTWENQQYLESCGLDPIPVFHFGEDFSWLKKYMDKYQYIGISGLGADIRKKQYCQSFGDRVFRFLFESGQEFKVHGFAATAFSIMTRYAWTTVDSTTWVKMPAFGRVIVPTYDPETDGFDYSKQPFICVVSDRSLVTKRASGVHYKYTMSEEGQKHVERFFCEAGTSPEIVGGDICERTKVCIHYYKGLMDSVINVDESKFLRSSNSFF